MQDLLRVSKERRGCCRRPKLPDIVTTAIEIHTLCVKTMSLVMLLAECILTSDARPPRGRDFVHVEAWMYDDLHEYRHLRALPHGRRHMGRVPNTCV